MKFNCHKVRDCIDGNIIYDYALQEPVTETLIRAMGQRLGQLEYFADFPRPFFRIQAKGWLELKGVQGETDIEVVFPSQNTRKRKVAFEDELLEL